MKKIFNKFINSQFCVTMSISVFLAVLSLFTLQYLTAQNIDPTYTLIGTVIVYVLLVILVANIVRAKFNAHINEDDDMAITSDIPVSLYNHITMAVALCSENGTILWGNKAFRIIFENSSAPTRVLDSLLGLTANSLIESGEEGLVWESSGKAYKVCAQRTASSQVLVTWTDITELEAARKRIADEETLIAFIMLDNIDEVTQIDQHFGASAIAKITSLLTTWSENVNGSLKEYERNKFMFLFSAKHLTGFLESQFPILEEVRNIGRRSSDDIGKVKTELSVTISIGIGAVGGSLTDKEHASRSALELALARGGDQVVLKNESGVQYYGGVTKTSQKRSTVRSRVVAERLVNLMNDSSAVFIMGHRFADYDAFGACIGIARLSMFLGRPCYIIRDKNNKGLTKCFEIFGKLSDYESILISADEAKALKNSSNPLLVIVDVNNRNNFDYPEIADTFARKVFIDHHRMAGEFGYHPLLQYIEPSSSSTCELICEILDQALPDVKLLKEEANIMLAGIMLDTKRFVLNTGVRTFAAAQYLRGQGANPSLAQEYFTSNIDSMQREAKFESKIQIYKKVIAISIIDDPCSAEDRIPAAKAADNMLTIDGVLASFVIFRISAQGTDTARISARSTGKINVQLIMEKLGGGGHYDQAAVESSSISIQEMLIQLKDSIDTYIEEHPDIVN